MRILPTWPIAAGALVIGLVGGGLGAHLWYADDIADLEIKIAQMKQAKAEDISVQSQAALKNLADATATIKEAAQSGQVSVTALSSKLDAIDRRYRNAKPPAPLPVDCKPGAERVRRLTEGASAVDEAIARSIPSK